MAALEQWPAGGVPANPGAWLMTVAKRRAVDLFRRNRDLERKYAEIGRDAERAGADGTEEFDKAIAEEIDDDLLRLIFTACHPVLPVQARVALTLRLLGGLTTAEIARAYLVPEPTIAQRIVRAKKTLASAQRAVRDPWPGRAPGPAGVRPRSHLPDLQRGVLGHRRRGLGAARSVPRGAAPRPPAGRAGAGRARGTRAGRADGDSRRPRLAARTGPAGEPVLLLDQDRSRWDRLLIRRGMAALDRATELTTEQGGEPGPYVLQAAIASCHARAFRPEETDWAQITALYGVLAQVMPSPVVELNRAVAVSMALRPAGRARPGRPDRGRARAARLPPAAQRPRRPADEARPDGRGQGRVRAGQRDDRQRARTRVVGAARPHGGRPTRTRLTDLPTAGQLAGIRRKCVLLME